MNKQEVQAYVTGFGRRFLQADVIEKYPETKIIPKYLKEHFSNAENVLDLGFGTGIWFWASFLPALKRIDGFDLYQESLDEVDRVLNLAQIPEGYTAAHEYLGTTYTTEDFKKLRDKRGSLFIKDYLTEWPEVIRNTHYDLVTEFGGIGELNSDQEFTDIIKKSADILKPGGYMMFVNFLEKAVPNLEKKLGRYTPEGLHLSTELYYHAVQEAGMTMVDFHAIENPEGMPTMKTFFYGYCQK